MSLGNLFLAATLILWGVTLLGWIAVSNTVLGVVALIAGILLLLEGAGVWSWNTPRR
jgi:hypothetical protein